MAGRKGHKVVSGGGQATVASAAGPPEPIRHLMGIREYGSE